MYEYKAHVVSVYDGDTIRADIDLGFNMVMTNVKIRLADIDTPEVRGIEKADGYISRDRLRELILDKDVIIQTNRDKQGKYGRWIGTIILPDLVVSVNELLVQEGLAERY